MSGTPRSRPRAARRAFVGVALLSMVSALVVLGTWRSDGRPGDVRAPRATAAAERILFAGTKHLGLAKVTGTKTSDPLFGAGPVHFDQEPSARGAQLVFTSLRDEAKPQVYLRDTAGAVHQLTTGMDTADPQLTPDGRTVVFDAVEPGGRNGATQRDLWLVGTDGTGLRRLTDTWANETQPTVSPDGQWIAYVCDADPQHTQIYLQRLDGSGSRRITDVTAGDAVDPAWNPVNDDAHRDLIAYTWQQGGQTGPRLRIITPQGGDRPVFTGPLGDWHTSAPTWLPDGGNLLFLSPGGADDTPVPKVFKAPPGATDSVGLMYSADRAVTRPAWLTGATCPCGALIVAQTSAAAPNVADLEDIRPDGVDPRDLGLSILREDPAADTVTDPAADPLFNPRPGYDPWTERQSYTPDGRQVVVTRFEDAPAGRVERVWLADADGGQARPMNLAGRGPRDWDTDPAFSPDGRRIAFTRTSPGGVGGASGPGRVLIADVATGAITGTIEPPAGRPGASDAQPAWSPDGKLIAFTRTETVYGNGGNKHIWTVPADALDRQSDLSRAICPGDCAVIDDSPAFSPDGRDIAFNRKGGDGQVNERDGVLVTSPTGADCQVVLPAGLSGQRDACRRELPDTSATGPFQPRDVAWSADGSQLVLSSRRALPPNSPEELSVYDVGTGRLTPVGDRLPGRQKEPALRATVDLSLSAPATTPRVTVGSGTAVTVTVTNHGPSPSPGTALTVSVPSGARITGATTTAGRCDITALRCDLGLLPPGGTVRITVAKALKDSING